MVVYALVLVHNSSIILHVFDKKVSDNIVFVINQEIKREPIENII